MRFASGERLAHLELSDDQTQTLLEVNVSTEVTQIVVANTNDSASDSVPITVYHSRENPPVFNDGSLLYDKIHVRTLLTIHSVNVGDGILMARGDTLGIKGASGIVVSVYGVTADIAPGGAE